MIRAAKKNLSDLILKGLLKKQKEIPSMFFYNSRGSDLFNQICNTEEYYLTRTETKILKENISSISDLMGNNILLLEFGSGSSIKTRILIENTEVSGYIPIDISYEHLMESVRELKEAHPELKIYPMPADYTEEFSLPETDNTFGRKIIFFPGSTIGNFKPEEAEDFLKKASRLAGEDGGMILGVDLVKDKRILENAYNDRAEITAQFNLNLLDNVNKITGSNFNPGAFEHLAFYNDHEQRIEMHLISKIDQCIKMNNEEIKIAKGENILTEYSHKYTIKGIRELVKNYFKVKKIFTDKNKFFAVVFLEKSKDQRPK